MVRVMGKHKDFIFVGRTSPEIAAGIIDRFGHGERTADGRPAITRPGPVIQFGINAFEDGEVNTTLFANGDLPNHPIVQNFTEPQKNEIAQSLKNARVTIVHSASGQNTSMRGMGLLFLVRSLKSEYGVDSVRLIAPALPFMRSDRNFSKLDDQTGLMRYEFNAIGALHFAELLKTAGVDEVVGFEPHSRDGVEHYRKVFGKKKARFINMGDFFAQSIRDEYKIIDAQDQPLVRNGSPDGMNKPGDYGMARARSLGEAIFKGTALESFASEKDFRNQPYMFGIHKERINSKETRIVDFHGDVDGMICFIIDDIISGGSTTLHAAEELKKRGAAMVVAIATHGVLVNGAAQRLATSPFIDRIMLTDTIPGVLDKLEQNGLGDHNGMVIRSIAPLIIEEIEPGFRPSKKLMRAYEQSAPMPQVG